ncbi:MAG: (Fe-S)-binding protein [Desulfatibacillum sp.]|nr:(Fe-S)-binding protein [Desulfatibacillum sp.]
MFDPSKCDVCGICLEQCQFLDFSKESASKSFQALINGDESPWINQCVTCFACNEYCDKDARPFDLICQRQEEGGQYLPKELVDMMHAHFSPQGEYTPPKVEGRAISLCTIYSVLDKDAFTGKLFDDATLLRGRFFFCDVLYLHMGNMSIILDEMPAIISRLAATGADEIVFVHDDCYSMIKLAIENGIELPFKAVHIFEYLRDQLKEHQSQISPLNLTLAYQRPCASRYSTEKEPLLDEIFSLIGVTRVDRKYDRKNALCCCTNAGDAMPSRKGTEKFQDANIADALDYGATGMAFLCPMCLQALSPKCKDAGLIPYFITDLCRMALGESVN